MGLHDMLPCYAWRSCIAGCTASTLLRTHSCHCRCNQQWLQLYCHYLLGLLGPKPHHHPQEGSHTGSYSRPLTLRFVVFCLQSCSQHQALSARKARGAGKQSDQQQQQQGPYVITRSAAAAAEPARDCADSMPGWLQDASQQRSSWQQQGIKQQQQQQPDQETSVGSDAMMWSPAKGSAA